MGKLTDRKIQATSTSMEEQEIILSDGNSLYLRCYPSGTKTFFYRYKSGGITTKMTIGEYPYKSLAEARKIAAIYNAQRKEGVDPSTEAAIIRIKSKNEKLKEIQEEKDKVLVRELFEKWVIAEIKRRKDSGAEVIRMFNKDVLPSIGHLPVKDISKRHIMEIVDSIYLGRDASRMAKVVLSLLRQMFMFGLERDIVTADPTAFIRKNKIGKKDKERDRYLDEDEIKKLSLILPKANLLKKTECAIWIALATGCRIGELLEAKWKDIDFKSKTWALEKNKTNSPIKIHLSKFSLEKFKLLRAINHDSDFCYPDKTNTKPISTKTVTKQIMDRQKINQRSLKNRSKDTTSLVLNNGPWTPHDLRRTAATLMVKMKIIPDVANRCLNHKEPDKMKRTYLQYNYQKEMNNAWEILGNKLEKLTVK